ncbi:uncharacterized protein LOC141849904 [Brevipalpus obovatus]|uniref:uncharacterized protein LOC141849904 n=1 Tax=Brevipalpus obovatus TaxID=246614 RepID=UPI003D9EFFCE
MKHSICPMFLICTVLLILLLSTPGSCRRAYNINRKIDESLYKGIAFGHSPQINGFKFYPPKLRRTYPNNGATNQSLEDSFEELLYETLGDHLRAQLRAVGLPEHGIPPIDPLHMERIHMEPLIGGDPFHIQLKNLRIGGLSNYQVREVSSKLSELRFKIALMFPKIEADCQYAVNGTMYEVLDIQGTGTAIMEYTDVLVRTTVNLDLINGTLNVASADAPYVDFSRSEIILKSSDGRTSLPSNSLSGELGPVLFWMLADEVVSNLSKYAYVYVNTTVKSFRIPPNFRPVVTWLVKRTSPSFNSFFFRRFSPSILFSNMAHAFSGIKHQINLPMMVESIRNIRSNFRSNLRRFIK